MYKVEKNVPLPQAVAGNQFTGSKYPFDKMDINDSVFFALGKEPGANATVLKARILSSARGWALRQKNKHRWYAEAREETREFYEEGNDHPTKENVVGVRLWRINDAN